MTEQIDLEILNLFLNNKDLYNKYYDSIIIEGDINKLLLEQINLIYTRSDNNNISDSMLINIINKLYPNNELKDYIDNIYSITIDNELTQTILDKALVKYKIHTIQTLIENKIKEDDYETLQDVTEILLDEGEGTKLEFGSLSLKAQLQGNTGLNWPLRHFNEILGPIPISSFGLVFAPVGCGKTAFLTTLATHWLKQDHSILHINNEDPYSSLLERYYANWHERSKEVIQANLEEADKRFVEANTNKLYILDSADSSLQRLDYMIKLIKPEMVFIDQLDALSKENDPNSLELLYRKIRNISKRRGTRIVGVTQASDTANDKTYLTMRDIHNSKVGKPAAFDYIIGINRSNMDATKRFVTMPKNKLKGIEGVPTQGIVHFNPTFIRYED